MPTTTGLFGTACAGKVIPLEVGTDAMTVKFDWRLLETAGYGKELFQLKYFHGDGCEDNDVSFESMIWRSVLGRKIYAL